MYIVATWATPGKCDDEWIIIVEFNDPQIGNVMLIR